MAPPLLMPLISGIRIEGKSANALVLSRNSYRHCQDGESLGAQGAKQPVIVTLSVVTILISSAWSGAPNPRSGGRSVAAPDLHSMIRLEPVIDFITRVPTMIAM